MQILKIGQLVAVSDLELIYFPLFGITDRKGSFQFNRLTEKNYMVVCSQCRIKGHRFNIRNPRNHASGEGGYQSYS